MKHLKQVVLPVLSMVLVSLFPCAFLYFQNVSEAWAVDMVPFFCIFLATAAGIFLLAAPLVRNVARAAVLADLGTLLAINFTLICNAIKGRFPGFHNILLLLAAGVVGLLLLIWFLRKKPNMVPVCGILALMFGVMTLVNGAVALPTLISTASHHRQAPAALEDTQFVGEKRNVYYMIFDEFGGPENLQRYFGTDHEDFFSALEDRGFSVSRTTKNTESPWTVTLVPNMMNLQYVTSDDVPINNRLEWLEDPALVQLFRANGYRINLVNQENFLGEVGCHVLTQNQSRETISRYLYENSIFCQIPRLKWTIQRVVLHRGPAGEEAAYENAKEAMMTCAEAVSGPTLTVCYVIAPHAPFFRDTDGSPLAAPDQANWHRPELYLTKLADISDAILTAVDNIQREDPEAVILLQGDHGARVSGHLVNSYGGPWFDVTEEGPYMENALCCAYIPGEEIDIEGDTCINATRKVLDQVFGLGLGTLPVPDHYDIPKEYMPPEPED